MLDEAGFKEKREGEEGDGRATLMENKLLTALGISLICLPSFFSLRCVRSG